MAIAMKKGFTIVELLMVVGIIGVLLGIVTTAASSSVKMARKRRAEALCKLVQAGLDTYNAQKGEWPVKGLVDKASSDSFNYQLTAAEVRQCVKALVDEAKKGNPVMDISGLFVSRTDGDPVNYKTRCTCGLSGCGGYRYSAPPGSFGLDFWPAIKGVRKKSSKKMTTDQMYFGYPHPASGAFIRFNMVYSTASDSITVYQWHWPSDE